MGLSDFFRREEPGTTPDRAGIVTRYKHLRAVGRTLNHKLVQRLSKDVLHEGGRKLGLLKRDTLVFNSEDETAILMDYCIYDVRRKGRNAFEQYLLDSAPAPESDEMVCLRAMQRAVYSLFIVESVIRGFGVAVRDLLSDTSHRCRRYGIWQYGPAGSCFRLPLALSRRFCHDGRSGTASWRAARRSATVLENEAGRGGGTGRQWLLRSRTSYSCLSESGLLVAHSIPGAVRTTGCTTASIGRHSVSWPERSMSLRKRQEVQELLHQA